MARYRLTLEYDGGPFAGWQRQDNGRSIQQAVEEAIERCAQERVRTIAAGRTDAGVHARGQVAHLDLARAWDPFRLSAALNHHLKPEPIAVLDCALAPGAFHARFSATARRYQYRIVNRRAPLAVERGRALAITRPLDAEAMDAAAQALVGRHDFSTFRASLCQAKSPVKTLSSLAVWRDGDEVRVAARAPSFLHHQVRNMVGSLLLVGAGKWRAADLHAALEARDRGAGGPTAPPHGLYLMAVEYDSPAPGAGDLVAAAG